MPILTVERLDEGLIIRLTPEATISLGLKPGDEVHLAKSAYGEISLAVADMDHQLRIERGRAYMRHLQSPL